MIQLVMVTEPCLIRVLPRALALALAPLLGPVAFVTNAPLILTALAMVPSTQTPAHAAVVAFGQERIVQLAQAVPGLARMAGHSIPIPVHVNV